MTIKEIKNLQSKGQTVPLIDVKKSGGEVLIHEIVGHAAPAIAGSETGNAVENENIVRKELNLQEREKEANHAE